MRTGFVQSNGKGETPMATLSVLKFNDPSGADRVLIALQGL
jgi:cyanate lyase